MKNVFYRILHTIYSVVLLYKEKKKKKWSKISKCIVPPVVSDMQLIKIVFHFDSFKMDKINGAFQTLHYFLQNVTVRTKASYFFTVSTWNIFKGNLLLRAFIHVVEHKILISIVLFIIHKATKYQEYEKKENNDKLLMSYV